MRVLDSCANDVFMAEIAHETDPGDLSGYGEVLACYSVYEMAT